MSASDPSIEEVTSAERLYDQDPGREWRRLEERRTEFGVTCLALQEYLPPPPARVLDLGAGPGRYAIQLARWGYTTTIVDVSQASLDMAVRKAGESGVGFEAVVKASAEKLAMLASSSFDAVVCLGPLYHLRESAQRTRAVRECVRVCRSDGIVLSSFLNRYSAVWHLAKVRPRQLSEDPGMLEDILATGKTDSLYPDAEFIRTCYLADISEIEPLMQSCGLQTVQLVGCEGVVAEREEALNQLTQDAHAKWVVLNYQLGKRRDLLTSSAHILHIGRVVSG